MSPLNSKECMSHVRMDHILFLDPGLSGMNENGESFRQGHRAANRYV